MSDETSDVVDEPTVVPDASEVAPDEVAPDDDAIPNGDKPEAVVADEAGACEPTAPQDVVYRVMHVESVLYDLTDPSPLVNLLEAEVPFRYLVVPIALADGIALQHAISEIEGRRPGTHELMTTILTRLQAEVIAARIVRFEAGVFYAELDLMTPRGREVVDCRASDAMSLALRQSVPAPVLCAEEVLANYYA